MGTSWLIDVTASTLPSLGRRATSFMSSCAMKSRPSQYASPRFATMPKFLKTPLFGGLYCQSTLPVTPSSAKTLSSFVVT